MCLALRNLELPKWLLHQLPELQELSQPRVDAFVAELGAGIRELWEAPEMTPEAKMAAKEAEKAEKQAAKEGKEAAKAVKIAEKAAEKEAKAREKELLKAQKEAEKQAAKEAREAAKAVAKAEKEALKAAAKAEKEAAKEASRAQKAAAKVQSYTAVAKSERDTLKVQAAAITVLAIDHAQGASKLGQYFHFARTDLAGLLPASSNTADGVNGDSALKCMVSLERTGQSFMVQLWGNANGGTRGDAHGRALHGAKPGTFQVGDRLLVDWAATASQKASPSAAVASPKGITKPESPPLPATPPSYQEGAKMQAQLEKLDKMGFGAPTANRHALEAANGEMEVAVDILLGSEHTVETPPPTYRSSEE